MKNVTKTLSKVNRRNLTNNTQKVAYRLLNAGGNWVSRSELERITSSAASRVRDLRKEQFGKFQVECESAVNLNKRSDRNVYFYRIRPTTVTQQQVTTVFRI